MRWQAVSVIAILGLVLTGCGKAGDGKSVASDQSAAPAAAQTPKPLSLGLTKKPEFPAFYLDHIGTFNDPIQNKGASVAGNQPLVFDGFGFDGVSKQPAKGVDIVIDGNAIGTAYGTPRPDVAKYNNIPGLINVGYKVTLPPGALKIGPHSVVVRVIAADNSGFYESPPISFVVQ